MWNLKCVSRCMVQLGSLALLLLSIPAVFGQSDNGSIVGFARDPSGAVVPKAKVTLRNESTGVHAAGDDQQRLPDITFS